MAVIWFWNGGEEWAIALLDQRSLQGWGVPRENKATPELHPTPFLSRNNTYLVVLPLQCSAVATFPKSCFSAICFYSSIFQIQKSCMVGMCIQSWSSFKLMKIASWIASYVSNTGKLSTFFSISFLTFLQDEGFVRTYTTEIFNWYKYILWTADLPWLADGEEISNCWRQTHLPWPFLLISIIIISPW